MQKILVIGGAGFIGCNVADYYCRKGNSVMLFDNLSRDKTQHNLNWLQKNHKDKVSFVKGDIRTDKDKLSDMMEKVDIVFHFAGQVAVTSSVSDPMNDFNNNLVGTINVLEALRNSSKKPILIFSSTNKVYGALENAPTVSTKTRYAYKNHPLGISEEQQLDFHSPYGCSKGASEQYVHDYSRIYGLKTIVFRQSCIYGYRQFGIEDQGWVSWFIIAATLKKPITVYGDGKQMRDILFIDDLCEAYDLAIRGIKKTSGNIYNIGGGPDNTLSILELIDNIKKIFRTNINFSFADWRPGDQKVFVCDIRKAYKDLGWKPKISPAEGIKKLAEWVGQNKKLFD